MLQKLREKIQTLFGFTNQELSAVFFLAVLTLAGALYHYAKKWDRSDSPIVIERFDRDSLSVEDSLRWQTKADSLLLALRSRTSPEKIDSLLSDLQDAPVNRVNINSANAKQIASLPGIGPKMAERIIAFRSQNGDFKQIEDLQRIKGIGKKVFDKIKPFIEI